MGKRIINLQETQTISNSDYLAVDSTSGGTKRLAVSALANAVTDVEVDGTSVVTSGVAEIDLSGKQDTLTAGSNISIAADGTISATDTTYSAGTGIQISNGVISSNITPGSTVTVTPSLVSGTKVADYSIDGTSGALYAPTPSVDDVEVDGASVVSSGVATINTMTGATSQANGAKGLVPQPTTADKDKYLKGDGTWDTPSGGGGASAMSDLTDVNLTSLANGQILKYDSANQEWVNANESGGGSSVIPNPTGTPTDTLDTVSIDGTIYEIQGSGGGGVTTTEEIYKNTAGTIPDTINLTKPINDFDIILITGFRSNSPTWKISSFYVSSTINSGDVIELNDDAYYAWYTVTDLSTLTKNTAQYDVIDTIYGLKFGSGGGGSGGILKGLDYANAVNLTLPDYTGYDYTPTGYGVLMATSYGGVGSIAITSQNEDAKCLSFRDDTWTTSWIPVTKDEIYHVKRGSSSTDFPSSSWFKFIPWLCESSGGSTAAEEMTLDTYDALTTAQKNDGTIRFIPDGTYGGVAYDMSNLSASSEYIEGYPIMNIVNDSSTKTIVTYDNIGHAIGCNFNYSVPIDVTGHDTLSFKVTNGSCYGGGTQAVYPKWDVQIGLMQNAVGRTALDITASDSRWVAVADMSLANHVYNKTIDVSQLNGSYYLTVVAHGWNTTIEDIALDVGEAYPSQIKYMSETYALDGDMHTYSTTEHQVGTWIDGSDVYEKSFEVQITATDLIIIEQDASYIDALLSFEGSCKSSAGLMAGSGMPVSTGWGFAVHRNASNQLILYGDPTAVSNGTAYVTIRYTKVTS